MRRFAELVLHHRVLVVATWVVLAVAGVIFIKPVNDRLTIDFFLPGQPGTTAARHIISDFGNGGNSSPYLVVFTASEGQTVTGHEPELATAFRSVAKAAPNLRLVDEATSSNQVFRSKDDRTSYAMVFYNFGNSPSARPPTPRLIAAAQSSAPSGWTSGITGEDVLSAGDSSASGPGVLGETLFGALGALLVLAFVFASFLALLPMLVAFASIMLTFLMLLPITHAIKVSRAGGRSATTAATTTRRWSSPWKPPARRSSSVASRWPSG